MSKIPAEKLGTEPIGKLLVSICTQTTLSVLLYSIYTLTDTFFIARGVSAFAAGGVSLAVPIVMVLGAVSTTVGTGGASVISRALGKHDLDKAARVAANAFLLFWLTAIMVTILGLIFLEPLMTLLGADAMLMPHAKAYARIVLIGAVTSTGFSAIIRAEGNAKFSLYIWIFPVITNLILDPVFIFGFHMGVAGAAVATVIAQSVSAGMSVYYFFFSKHHAYTIKAVHMKLEGDLIKEIIAVGSPSLISQVSVSVFTVFINRMLGNFGGAEAITAFGIVSRITGFLTMPQTGIVQGMQPIIGYNYAANQLERVKKAVTLSVYANIIYGIIILLVSKMLKNQLVGIFVKEEAVFNVGIVVLSIIGLSFPFKGVSTIVSAYFQAEGKPMLAFALPLIGIVFIQFPILVLLANRFSLIGIWYSFLISEALTCFLCGMVLWLDVKKYK